MSNLLLRSITGILFGAVMITFIWLGGWYSAMLFGVIALLSLYEFYQLIQAQFFPQKTLGIVVGAVTYGAIIFSFLEFINWGEALAIGILLLFPLVSLLIELFRKKEAPFINVSITVFGVLYIITPYLMLGAIENLTDSTLVLLGFFILIWTNDTFAYFTGRLIGKHKLFERISPKKTWEGSFGGLVFSLITGYILFLFTHTLALHQWLILALIVVIFGSLGDLIESMLKRSLNVKDSGKILPGHGGILDRFDGVIIASPVAFVYLYLIHIL